MKTVFENDYVTVRGMETGLAPNYGFTIEDIESQIEHLLEAARTIARTHECDDILAMKCIRFAKDGEF
jgi:hypothetical protein